MNNYEKAVKELAPCGIDCSRCATFNKGDIVKLSRELKEKLTNYENLAQILQNNIPILKHYKEFLDILTYFTQGGCDGCRYTDKPKCQCSISSCVKEHNINFCSECSEFPCNPNTYNEFMLNTWKSNNMNLKKNGVENFYILQSEKPRY